MDVRISDKYAKTLLSINGLACLIHFGLEVWVTDSVVLNEVYIPVKQILQGKLKVEVICKIISNSRFVKDNGEIYVTVF